MAVRRYFQASIRDLEALAEASATSREVLAEVFEELTFRGSSRADTLRVNLAKRLGMPGAAVARRPAKRLGSPEHVGRASNELLQFSQLQVVTDPRASSSDPPVTIEWANQRLALAINWKSRQLLGVHQDDLVAMHLAHCAVDILADFLAQRRSVVLTARILLDTKDRMLQAVAARILEERKEHGRDT